MGWGVVIILIFSGMLGIMIKLYEDHVDYLNREIRTLRMKIDDLDETVQTYGGIIDDEQHYYEKWRESDNDVAILTQKLFEQENELQRLRYELNQRGDM